VAGSFVPAPKVDSAILLIDKISRHNFPTPATEQKFFDLLHRGFNQKRKMLKNNLGWTDQEMLAAQLEPKIRAEDLSLADWLRLTTI
jgi:16S rRNA A1518/A1519 N6-dimethyltransferase RsmA/KsgA/DIM1 with predicted DNA glycosylase/AP lyase activity